MSNAVSGKNLSTEFTFSLGPKQTQCVRATRQPYVIGCVDTQELAVTRQGGCFPLHPLPTVSEEPQLRHNR